MFVEPKVFLVGYTTVDPDGLGDYLMASGNTAFAEVFRAAIEAGVHHGEALCSFYAKLCYAALGVGENLNVTKVRDIPDNVKACLSQGHGSVFEHCQLNFVVRDCSRVFTHELVRHRVGTAFSQTSGRYVRRDRLDIVTDPILADSGVLTLVEQECIRVTLEVAMQKASERIDAMECDFTKKKKLTSAVRRFLPNGQANEIGLSVNLRALRHLVMMRTARGAEREIRLVFAEVYRLVKAKFPLIFCDAQEGEVDGILEVTGMRTQPYG